MTVSVLCVDMSYLRHIFDEHLTQYISKYKCIICIITYNVILIYLIRKSQLYILIDLYFIDERDVVIDSERIREACDRGEANGGIDIEIDDGILIIFKWLDNRQIGLECEPSQRRQIERNRSLGTELRASIDWRKRQYRRRRIGPFDDE